MSTFATLGVILSILAGLINFAYGLARREQMMLMLMRFGLSIFSFITAAAIIISRIDGVHLFKGVSGANYYLYLFFALALYVGLTLMLPATIERNNPALAAAQAKPKPTGKLSGNGGVRVMNQNEEWVN